ncbi:MAG: T9SS type A sorting domain-containing protein [Ignavibacteriales bacterium]|nr:T9SS type A sorting domain-containing protein [Ignavibacteriales bacterium]
MNKKAIIAFVILSLSLIFLFSNKSFAQEKSGKFKISQKENLNQKKAKQEYYHKMLRDPIINEVPYNIRDLELSFARELNLKGCMMKENEIEPFAFYEIGPNDLGGRTRALAIDITDTNTIIAGAVSGGIWKSTDGGNTWTIKSHTDQNLSVTSIVQDLRPDSSKIWYYSTGELGEYNFPSASDRGLRAYFLGSGIFKSTDDGETWDLLPATKKDPTQWNSPYDYVSKIIVSPKNGNIFFSSSAFGIYRSTNGGSTFTRVLGRTGDNIYCDININKNGTLIAYLSEYGNNTFPADTGIFISKNEGNTWTNITPSEFPEKFQRGIIAVAPSDTNIIYVLANTGQKNILGNDDVRFFMINITSKSFENRTNNLPDFVDGGILDVEYNFCMTLSVKPDDKNFVLLGGTNLFRSTNGFATKPLDAKTCWIGGYSSSGDNYPSHHSGQHIIVFNPQHPLSCYSGHSGGISFTSNISNNSFINYFPWENKNTGYNVTQFYTVSLPHLLNDYRIMGGTQDNGTPFFFWDTLLNSNSTDVSSGNGGYCYFTDSVAYVSTVGGRVVRLGYNTSGQPDENEGWSNITPKGSSGQSFINPYIIDALNEDIMYYAAGNTLWRNNSLSSIPDNEDSTSQGWYEFTNMKLPEGFELTALTMSPDTNLKHLLYYGASSLTEQPRLYKLKSAEDTTTGAKYTIITGASSGTCIHDIAINPIDAKELIVVLSNYNITGIFHSIDSGKTFTAIEGNLTGNTANPGPSIRCASIINTNEGKIYLVGTSTGLYSTETLTGASTVWLPEGQNEIGNVVVENIDVQKFQTTIDSVSFYDYRIAVATHGRGLFIGLLQTKVGIINTNNNIPNNYYLSDNYPNPFNPSTKIDFSIPKSSQVSITIFNITGEKIIELVSGNFSAGTYYVNWNGRNQFGTQVASGIYFYQIKADKFTETKKMMLLK